MAKQVRPPAAGTACSDQPAMSRSALDGDTAIWVRDDGSVAEQSLRALMALFHKEQKDGTLTRLGPYSWSEAIRNFKDSRPVLVPNVSNATGVAVVEIITAGRYERLLFSGLMTLETTGLRMQTIRTALLSDGSLAVWAMGSYPVTYPAAKIRNILGGARIVSIQDGRFILSDGTMEDGVIERLTNQPDVMAGLYPGLGTSRCEAALGCAILPRTSKELPSFKYRWETEKTPIRCVAHVMAGAVLLQNGNLHRIAPEGIVTDAPLETRVASFSAAGATRALVRRDGTLWYARADEPLKRIEGVSGARSVWLASENDSFESVAGGVVDRYWAGAWFTTTNGQFFRWGETASRTSAITGADGTATRNPGKVQVAGSDYPVAMTADGDSTLALLASGFLFSWVSETSASDSIFDNRVEPGGWIEVGETGPGNLSLLDPITNQPGTTLLDHTGISGDRILLADRRRGRVVEGVSADGVAQLLLRIPTFGAGYSVTVKVRAFDCPGDALPPGCPEARYSPDEYGSVGSIGKSWESLRPQQAFSDTATSDPTVPEGVSAGLAFMVYRAPMNFVRKATSATTAFSRTATAATTTRCPEGYNKQDCSSKARAVYLEISYEQGTRRQTYLETIEIVRPPVILIHGLASSACTWKDFDTQVSSHQIPIGTIKVDYSNAVPVAAAFPQPSGHTIPASAIGVEWNVGPIRDQINAGIITYKDSIPEQPSDACVNQNSAPLEVASVQADIVAHSMGGLIAKAIWHDANSLKDENYKRGYFHKLITLGTPYFGSPYAAAALTYGVRPIVRALSSIQPYSWVQPEGGEATDGAVLDFRGALSTGKAPIQNDLLFRLHLPPCSGPPLPLATIAGEASKLRLSGFNWPDTFGGILYGTALSTVQSRFLTGADGKLVPSDGIVTVFSALDGQQTGSPGTFVIQGVVHSREITGNSDADPRHLVADPDVFEVVAGLLNSSAGDSARFRIVLPDPAACRRSFACGAGKTGLPSFGEIRQRAYQAIGGIDDYSSGLIARYKQFELGWDRVSQVFPAYAASAREAYRAEMGRAGQNCDVVKAYEVAVRTIVPIMSFAYPDGVKGLENELEDAGVVKRILEINENLLQDAELDPKRFERLADLVDDARSQFSDRYVRNLDPAVERVPELVEG